MAQQSLIKRARIVPRWAMPRRQPKLKEHPGRPYGMPHGVWVANMVSREKPVILCWRCQSKFDHKHNHYYKDKRFPYVVGRCDGCREMAPQAAFYLHESFLTDYGGRTRSGQSWLPA